MMISVICLVFLAVAASPSVVKRQTDSTTRIPPGNPEITSVYKVSCNCLFLPQYDPVCGSDGLTYGNKQILDCAIFCGTNVTLVYNNACGSNRG